MSKSSRYLLVGSVEAYTGKSATIVGLARQLQSKGLNLAYGKPLGKSLSAFEAKGRDEDVEFIVSTLGLPPSGLLPTILCLDEQSIQARIKGEDRTDYQELLGKYAAMPDRVLALLEGPGTLAEGSLFDLSLLQIATVIDAAVVLVARYNSEWMVDRLLSAKQHLGDRLVGVLINDITTDQLELFDQTYASFLENQGVPVLGRLPTNNLLQSVSVQELVHQLEADVLCGTDRLDLMVESLRIGAMNVNSALKYFAKGQNMAVVTGGDRTDIQLAALETSTQCLVLTGQIPPSELIVHRAEELEVPILSVDKDTLTTVEIIERTFGKVRLHEQVKVDCITQLMATHCDIDRLLEQLGLQVAVSG